MLKKKSLKRWRAIPLLLLTAGAVSLSAQEAPRGSSKFKAGAVPEATTTVSPARVQKSRSERAMAPVIVKFNSESVAAVAGTTLRANGLRSVNIQSTAATRQFERLANDRRAFQAAAARSVPEARIVHDLSIVIGGVSMVVPEDQVAELSRLPGVQKVYRDELMQLTTDRSPQFIGASQLHAWADGRGAGVVVGVLDTGIWPEHPSYSDPDPNGVPYPEPPATWTGTACEFGSAVPGDAPFTCNNKLIGADRFMSTYDAVFGLLPTEFPSARDDNGHGTHTSSTAAGNARVNANIFGVNRGRVTGIAPRAHVVMYKVCGDEGCFGSDSAAAVQQAIVDGVDVLNFSIDGGQSPYADVASLAFLDAYNAGVFVAASAGNSGPGPDTVAHREPWVATVAASTHTRHFLNRATIVADNGDTLEVQGASVTAGIGNMPVVVAGDAPFNDPLCQNSTADGAFTGRIVVCQRGGNARVEKSFNVQRRGGVGMILYNPTLLGLSTDNHYVPTSHIENDQGAALLAFLGSHTGETASLTAGVATNVQGDKMAVFSSRGGPGQTLGISKPDVTAPGVQILAGDTPAAATPVGGPPGQLFQAIDGTSMSSPHVAGAAALLAGKHPDWTPGQIKSALMLTAKTSGVFKEDGVTPSDPFDRGSGRIRVNEADDPGLSISDTGANFLALQANLSTANYPSLYVPTHPGVVTVNRRLHNELPFVSSWHTSVSAPPDVKVTVTPNKFDIPTGGDVDVAITVDASAVPVGQVRFARIRFNSGSNIADFPISFVRRPTALSFAKNCTPATFPRLTSTNCTVTLTNTSFDDANVTVTDNLPARLRLLSVSGATFVDNRNWVFNGVIDGAEPPSVSIAPGASPAGGYLPLSGFGIPPIGGMTDDTIVNFNVPGFTYAGETYTSLGVGSNGYVVVGGGTGADVTVVNQNFPNPARPNNVLAPFWTDLNPAAGGAVRIGILSDGTDDWIVIDWNAVRNFSSATTQTFQIWIGLNGDGNPGQDISYAYGPVGGGDLGFLSVGAENRFGNRGQNTFFNGAGTAPANGQQLRVTSTPAAPGETHVISFSARGQSVGAWTNCARATAAAIFFGTATACTSGEVTP
jgi:subtilisin family serine protease